MSFGPRSVAWIVASATLTACAAGGTTPGTGGGGAGAGATSGSTTDATSTSGTGTGGDYLFDAGTSDAAPSDGCSDQARMVYVLGKGRELYSFDPPTLTLSQVGVLTCPQGGGAATPFSMSVDRSGTAWVLYNDGHLYRVDTKTAACSATTFVPDQSGFKTFGMGFVADAPGSQAETLYVANTDGLGKIDTGTLALTPIGQFGFAAAAELTGTGDAKLFGFFFGFPPYISEIDKATAALGPEADVDGVDVGTGFAFAFWGGDFWVFTATGSADSQIHRYQPATQATTLVKASTGFKIVGAGVSTCAPLEPPK